MQSAPFFLPVEPVAPESCERFIPMPLSYRITNVASLEHPGLHAYRTLRRPVDHFQKGIFVAEGAKVVRRLLQSDFTILSMLLTPEWLERLRKEDSLAEAIRGELFIADKTLLQQIVGFNVHQGIMAVGCLPEQRPLEQSAPGLPTPHLLVALDGLAQAENVGVIVRNCAAFHVDALLVSSTSSSPYLRRAVRNSMGTVFGLRVIHVERLPEALMWLKAHCGTVIFSATPAGEISIINADFAGNSCIVLGNEESGVSPEILSLSDHRVAIPIRQATDSINVASASAVCLYEASKQRRE